MTRCWCVNFEHPACLEHGIQKKLWLMQYQYGDGYKHIYQSGKRQKGRICVNWRRLGEISEHDWFVAYLPKNMFFAIGEVRTPRRIKRTDDSTNTIENYLNVQRSHDHQTGYIYYTPVFYENFNDKWRRPDDVVLLRYPQRIDVHEWLFYVPEGITIGGLGKKKNSLNAWAVKPNELHTAAFPIKRDFFEAIATRLAGGKPFRLDEATAGKVEHDDSALEVFEKRQAKGQGFLLDNKLRKALEEYAMNAAKRYFKSLGYVVEDHSKGHP